ncbi:GGDEF domain-containing protein [Azomonas macrocytogenes]|uniref:Diguanylate cyclase DosC n=1 Tax=Azomonas macrocytogenes TaxID=69962 RepID=A0A839T2P8_AZOMA|nr:GGDEF domain-containing protein [Azomonas macrocytogenes]MBB3103269.1 diguanylate cyclase [Azomonas macrocytogenes]
MQQPQTEQLTTEWRNLIARTSAEARDEVRVLARQHAAELTALFYREMLKDPASASFLSHEQVKNHLSHSLQQWIIALFSVTTPEELKHNIEQQKSIGQVHARVEIPVSLVLRGGRLLKNHLVELLEERNLDDTRRREASSLCYGLIDLALEIMCLAFSQSHDRSSRAEEAYRLFSISHNIRVEKERQRAALLDWENQLMFDLATGNTPETLSTLTGAEFGLWFRHKASHAFQGSPESNNVLQLIHEIDHYLPKLADTNSGIDTLRQIRERTRSIKYLLDSLFEQAGELEAGRDVLTRLLNRKFLPVVMGKEMHYSRTSGQSFAVLMLDVDHFKSINDTYGHEAGDLVLQQVAGILSSNTRGGDYAFRMGGEEFLVILVDIIPEKALLAAEKLRQLIESERFKLPQDRELHITVSVGIAPHDGHPDYQQLLQRADQALYQAKSNGRNQCVLLEG